MCRWLLYTGEPKVLADLLITPEHSLIKQSMDANFKPGLEKSPLYDPRHVSLRNHVVNADGFGVGWYNKKMSPKPCVFTSVTPAWNNRNLVRLAAVVESPLVFAHVRAASIGSIVSAENCHPFQHGRYMFMHNGDVASFGKIKRAVRSTLRDDIYNMIEGTTDSEHIFALMMNEIPDETQPTSPKRICEIMTKVIHEIEKYSGGIGETRPSSLNLAISDGSTIVATRYRSSPNEDPPSLYYWQGFETEHSARKSTIISSEPLMFHGQWNLVPKDHMIVIREGTEEVELNRIE